MFEAHVIQSVQYCTYFLYSCKENAGKWKAWGKAFLALLIFANTSLYKQRHGFQKIYRTLQALVKVFLFSCVLFMILWQTVPARCVPGCFFFGFFVPCIFLLAVTGGRARICIPFKEPSNRFPASRNRFLLAVTGCRALICKPFKEPRNRFSAWRAGTRQTYLMYRPARLHRLAQSIPWNRFLGTLNVEKYGLWLVTHTFSTVSSGTYFNDQGHIGQGRIIMSAILTSPEKSLVQKQIETVHFRYYCFQ